MLKSRIILIAISVLLIAGLYLLPKVVVENDDQMSAQPQAAQVDPHSQAPEELVGQIRSLVTAYQSAENEKKAIFADSLASLYAKTGEFDSAGWYAEDAATFFNTEASWVKAGDQYYQAYTFALDTDKQNLFATKAQQFFTKVLEKDPGNLEAKTKMGMTYLSSGNPMQGITMLREVLQQDPEHELALFNLGMLSIQSGQEEKAVDYLNRLLKVNPVHIQGNLLLGMAYMNSGEKQKARLQFEKVKQMDKDPAVQATVDSYLKDLK